MRSDMRVFSTTSTPKTPPSAVGLKSGKLRRRFCFSIIWVSFIFIYEYICVISVSLFISWIFMLYVYIFVRVHKYSFSKLSFWNRNFRSILFGDSILFFVYVLDVTWFYYYYYFFQVNLIDLITDTDFRVYWLHNLAQNLWFSFSNFFFFPPIIFKPCLPYNVLFLSFLMIKRYLIKIF